jgi:hypothetical protein
MTDLGKKCKSAKVHIINYHCFICRMILFELKVFGKVKCLV